MTRTNICNFFKILKSKCSLFAAVRCKTVGTKQETWSESKTMMSFDKNNVFLANFCSKNKNSHSSKTKSDLSPVFLNVDFPARRLQPIIGSNTEVIVPDLLQFNAMSSSLVTLQGFLTPLNYSMEKINTAAA